MSYSALSWKRQGFLFFYPIFVSEFGDVFVKFVLQTENLINNTLIKMKKIYVSMLAFGVAFGATAQVAQQSVQQFKRIANSGTVALEQPVSTPSVAATGDTISGYYYDFSVPANWIFGNEGGATDSWVIGTTVPAGDFPIDGIESTTAANGFALYDSDLICGVNDNAYVQLANSVDLTGFASVNVVFQQHYRKYQDQTFVEVSTDGGSTWTSFEVNGSIAGNDGTDNPAFEQVNISGAIAANPSTVWIRFRFQGACDYSWMVDDVAFAEGASDDLKLTDSWHGDILLDWEYQQIPLEQVQEVVLGAATTNAGGAAQTNAIYTWDISDGSASVASGTFPAANASIDPTVSDTTWYATGFTPDALGTYTVSISVAGDQTDAVPADNEAMSMFMVTESIFAHDDEDNIEFQINGGDDENDEPNEYKAGMYYTILNDATITSVQVAFGGNTTTSSCIVEVFESGDLETALTTSVYDFEPGDIVAGGAVNLVNILIEDGDGILLTAETTYLIAIGNGTAGEDLWVLASDGDADGGQLRYGPFGAGGAIDWYTGYTTSPVIRANFDATVGVEENNDVSGVYIFPNPATDLINVGFVSKENQNVTANIISSNGSLIQSESIIGKAGQSSSVRFNTTNLSAGIYMVQLVGANSTLTQTVVVQ
ncbi:MAG: hypothetical protein ACI8P5_001627 [Bacteroidia bacterium]|jgi:hypothetical protein